MNSQGLQCDHAQGALVHTAPNTVLHTSHDFKEAPVCSLAVWRCTEGVPLPTAPQQWSSVLKKSHCPPLPSKEALHITAFTAHCPPSTGQCTGLPLPTAPRQGPRVQ